MSDGTIHKQNTSDWSILKKPQIGAGERRTVPAGHGFKTTATTEVSVGDDERNDAESERRRLQRAAEQPSTKRRSTPAEGVCWHHPRPERLHQASDGGYHIVDGVGGRKR